MIKYAVALLILLSLAGRASADCPPLTPPKNPLGALSNLFGNMAAGASDPLAYQEQQQRLRAQRATYEALLAAGAPEPTACAAALNPQVFQAVAPTYLNRPAR